MKAKARAHSNIAFTKYWGYEDAALHLPCNNSISLTLDAVYTITSVEFDEALKNDELLLNGQPQSGPSLERASRFLDVIRRQVGTSLKAQVISENNFPTGAGIASSASGFAALTLAATHALGLALTPGELSAIARIGSGSASRSLFGGFVEWQKGSGHETSVARQLFPSEHWPELRNLVVITSQEHKRTGSKAGHGTADSSPLHLARVDMVNKSWNTQVQEAVEACDLNALGEIIEQDALAMHAVMMTSTPSIVYWNGTTVELIHAIRGWREEGVNGYFTIDAGPNIHLITEAAYVETLLERLKQFPGVQDIIVCAPGPDPTLLEE
jgi:diphosphomevalonate decarboxylase